MRNIFALFTFVSLFLSFQKQLTQIVKITPDQFTNKLDKSIRTLLLRGLYNRPLNKSGYIVAVTRIESTGDGIIMPLTGDAVFNVKFQAIIFRPYKNEVVDGTITKVDRVFSHLSF